MFCMLDRENNAVAPSFQQFHRPIQGVMARIVPLNSPERIPSNISFEDRYKDLVFSHLGDQSFSQHLLQTLFDLNPRNSTSRILSHNKEVDRPLLQHDFFPDHTGLNGKTSTKPSRRRPIPEVQMEICLGNKHISVPNLESKLENGEAWSCYVNSEMESSERR